MKANPKSESSLKRKTYSKETGNPMYRNNADRKLVATMLQDQLRDLLRNRKQLHLLLNGEVCVTEDELITIRVDKRQLLLPIDLVVTVDFSKSYRQRHQFFLGVVQDVGTELINELFSSALLAVERLADLNILQRFALLVPEFGKETPRAPQMVMMVTMNVWGKGEVGVNVGYIFRSGTYFSRETGVVHNVLDLIESSKEEKTMFGFPLYLLSDDMYKIVSSMFLRSRTANAIDLTAQLNNSLVII